MKKTPRKILDSAKLGTITREEAREAVLYAKALREGKNPPLPKPSPKPPADAAKRKAK